MGDALESARLAVGEISSSDAAELCASLVAIPSPTGGELALAETIVERLRGAGVTAVVQQGGNSGANVLCSVPGHGTGSPLIVVAGLDTGFTGQPVDDEPWLGEDIRSDHRPLPMVSDGTVIGLGAENPKGLATAGLIAVMAIARSGIPLDVDLMVAFVGGDMPYFDEGEPDHPGFGSGLESLLDTIPEPGHALVLKPGDHVVWTEVGQTWLRVRLFGLVGYTGARHKGTYVNPILLAAPFIERLDRWLTDVYTESRATDRLAPQGAITTVRAGAPIRTVFSPNHVDLFVDLRTLPDDDDGARRDFEQAVSTIAGELDIEASTTVVTSAPGSETDPAAPVVRRTVSSWEWVSGQDHMAAAAGSSASNAWRLRRRGIPTARVGLGRSRRTADYPGLSMGVVDDDAIAKLARIVIEVALRTCAVPDKPDEYDSGG